MYRKLTLVLLVLALALAAGAWSQSPRQTTGSTRCQARSTIQAPQPMDPASYELIPAAGKKFQWAPPQK